MQRLLVLALVLVALVWFLQGRILWNEEEEEVGNEHAPRCPIHSISEVSPEFLHPTVGDRWVVTPPQGGNLALMCCETTQGSFNILLHEQWAPIGVTHLLKMLSDDYFSESIPLFRCTDACQFGLSSNTTKTRQFDKSIQDDVSWLPTGPSHRTNAAGVARYPKGVLTHAGAGPNTRSNQFVLTLQPNRFMGGGSPWEVPMGEVVAGINVLDKFYTGYGEKGPSQPMLRKSGVTKEVREKWPLLDYILQCGIVDQGT
jgi:homoserine O-acetyltransferase